MEELYRGVPIDDRLNYEAQKPNASKHYLIDALTAHLDGKEVAIKSAASPGCLIALPGKAREQHKQISYTHYPDGSNETLLNVPAYDFNWQHIYMPTEPKYLPAGTRVVCHAIFDNSTKNKYNPDPAQLVKWGDQSFDEMLIGYICITEGKPDAGLTAMNQ